MIIVLPPEARKELQERHRQIHESAALVHDRAAVMHDKAAALSEANGRPDQAERQRERAQRERRLALESRRTSAESVVLGMSPEWADSVESVSEGSGSGRGSAPDSPDGETTGEEKRALPVERREAVAGTGSDIEDGLRASFVPYPWADNGCVAAWAEAWSHADVWCCPHGRVRLIYDHADRDVASRVSAYHLRSAHDRTPDGEGDFGDTSCWVTQCAQTMDCYLITDHTLARVLALPSHEYARLMEPTSILSRPSVTWWRDQG